MHELKNKTDKFRFLLPVLSAFSALMYLLFNHFIKDSDPIWSAVVGKFIVTNLQFPNTDVFSWTVSGKPWIAMEWLFCVITYLMRQIQSIPVLNIDFIGEAILAFVVFAFSGILIYKISIKKDSSNSMVWFSALGIFALTLISATPRAYIFTILFISAIMYILRLKRNTGSIYLLPVIMILWGNIQSSALLGAAIILTEGVASLIINRDRKLIVVSLISIPATLINPYTYKMWLYLSKFLFMPDNKFISEWKAPNFDDKGTLVLYLLLTFFAILFTAEYISKLKISFAETFRPIKREEVQEGTKSSNSKSSRSKSSNSKMPPLMDTQYLKQILNGLRKLEYDKFMVFMWFWISLVYSISAIRGIYYLFLFWILLTAYFFPDVIKKVFKLKPFVLGIILGLFTTFEIVCFFISPGIKLDEEIYPKNAVAYLTQHSELTENLFNNYVYGGALTENGIKVFIDGRADVYIENGVLRDYMNCTDITANPIDIMNKYGVRNLLLKKNEKLDIFFSTRSDWQKVYEDNYSVIFTRM